MPEIVLDYAPYPHQQEVHEAKSRIKAVMWPIRSGKDYSAIPEWIKETIVRMPEWSARTDVTPRWHTWGIGPTFPLTKQLWRDIKRLCPRELMAGPPRENDMSIPLINDGLLEMKSADDPERLVASAIDFVMGTECGLWKPEVWSMSVRGRLSSPGRFGKAILNGTPQGQVDLNDPRMLHWFWSMVLQGRNPDNWDYLRSWYWYEDRVRFGGLEHPILSRTHEGKKELEAVKKDPNISDRYFRQNYMGECLPVMSGRPVIVGFDTQTHVDFFEFNNIRETYISIDFGRNYPFATIHQFSGDGKWWVLGEFAPIQEDLTDEEFIYRLQMYVNELCPDAVRGRMHWLGDHESVQKQDSRRDSTKDMMRNKFKINLLTMPTRKGDELLAIDVMNGRMKLFGKTPSLVIHPRCSFSIQCFLGGWFFKTGKTKDYSWTEDKCAEVHPYIDCFDTFKYVVRHVIRPFDSIRERDEAKRMDDPYGILEPENSGVVTDPVTGIPL